MTENEMEGTSLADHVFEMAACMNAVLSEQAHRNEDLADESYARQRAIEQDGVCCGVCGLLTVDQIGELANGEPVCEQCADEVIICADCGLCIPIPPPKRTVTQIDFDHLEGKYERLQLENTRLSARLDEQNARVCYETKRRTRNALRARRFMRVYKKALKAIEDATERARGGHNND